MRSVLRRAFLVLCLATLAGSPAFAQAKAKAQNVPEIPYESVPNLLKMPPGLYLGEAMGVATNSKGHIFVYTRSATTRLFEFDQNGNYVREIGEGSYGFEFAHSVRVDPQDNIWVGGRRHRTWSSSSIPKGRIVMVLGRRPEAVAGHAVEHARRSDAAGGEIHAGPSDRRRLGCAGQHLRLRRLRQPSRREVRQERTVPQAGRQRAAGIGAEPVQPAARPRRRRAGQRLRRRPHQQPDAGVRQQPRPARDLRQHRRRRGRVCVSPGPHQYLFTLELQSERQRARARGTTPARSTRWSWTARSSGASATRASSSAAFRSCT